jgi:elongation factor 1-gamma
MGKTNRSPEFLAKFPFGKVPAFEAADGTTLFESDAITQYIAESGPASAQLMGSTPAQRALIRQWICFADGEVVSPVIRMVMWRVKLGGYDEKTETSSLQTIERSLNLLENHLKDRTWFATQDKLSLADITMASALCWGFQFIIDEEMRKNYPSVVAWYERTVESDGVKQAFGEKNFIDKRQTYQG